MSNTALSRRAALARGALGVYLTPLLAQDATINLTPILADVTAKNWKAKKPTIIEAIAKATVGKLAQDADLEDMPAMLDNMDDDTDTADDPEATPAAAVEVDKPDPAAAVCELLAGKIPPELLDQVKNLLAGKTGDDAESIVEKIRAMVAGGEKKPAMDEPTQTPGTPAAPGKPGKEKPAMDQATIDAAIKLAVDAAIKTAQTSAVATVQAIAQAKEDVRPLIGEINVAMDGAAPIYKLALDQAGIDLTGVPEAAYPAMVKMLRTQQLSAGSVLPILAADAGADDSFTKMFPDAPATVRVI